MIDVQYNLINWRKKISHLLLNPFIVETFFPYFPPQLEDFFLIIFFLIQFCSLSFLFSLFLGCEKSLCKFFTFYISYFCNNISILLIKIRKNSTKKKWANRRKRERWIFRGFYVLAMKKRKENYNFFSWPFASFFVCICNLIFHLLFRFYCKIFFFIL